MDAITNPHDEGNEGEEDITTTDKNLQNAAHHESQKRKIIVKISIAVVVLITIIVAIPVCLSILSSTSSTSTQTNDPASALAAGQSNDETDLSFISTTKISPAKSNSPTTSTVTFTAETKSLKSTITSFTSIHTTTIETQMTSTPTTSPTTITNTPSSATKTTSTPSSTTTTKAPTTQPTTTTTITTVPTTTPTTTKTTTTPTITNTKAPTTQPTTTTTITTVPTTTPTTTKTTTTPTTTTTKASTTQPTTTTTITTVPTTTPTTTKTTTTPTTTTTTPSTTTTLTTTTTLPQFTGWTSWGPWTTCSVTCGSGVHKRYRRCHKISSLDPDCIGKYVQSAVCTATPCPTLGKWSTWFQWGNCGVSCGGGVQTRTRACQKTSTYDLDCIGEIVQEQNCNSWSCPDCSKICEVGKLNDACDECVCESATVTGRIVTTVGSPVGGATISPESAPMKILAKSNSSGFFNLDSICITTTVFVSKQGFQDTAVEIIGPRQNIELKKEVLPRMVEQPQSKFRLSGENVTFCCKATGSPNITYYEWFRDSVFLSKSFYRDDGKSLQLSYVKNKHSGQYTCRANSPIGAIISTPATLKVKDKEEDFCKDALLQKRQLLPFDCVQADTNTATYEVGECVSRRCRTADVNDTDKCRETSDFCCIPSVSEMKILSCADYEIPVIVVKECGCGSCSTAPVKLNGKAVSAKTGEALEYVDVWLNGELVSYADDLGSFVVDLSKAVDKAVITLKDTFKRGYLDVTKIIDITEGLSGSISLTIHMVKAAPLVPIDHKKETVLNAVANLKEQHSKSSKQPVAQISIPANAFVRKDGSKFSGSVSSRLTVIDPVSIENEETIPGRFQFIDEEGVTTNLASKGVFNLMFQDENGEPLFVDDVIDVTLPEINDKNFTLWALSEETGIWEPLVPDHSIINRRRKRRRTENMIGELSDMGKTTWYNVDRDIYTQNVCYYKVRLYKNKDLTQSMPNPSPLTVESHQKYDNTSFSFKQHLKSPEEECLSVDCQDKFGYIRVFYDYDSSLTDETRDFLAARPVLPLLKPPVTLEYDHTLDEHKTFKVRFTSSVHGPFYRDKAKCEASGEEDSHLRFYLKSVKNDVITRKFFKNGRKWAKMVKDGVATVDEMQKHKSTVWYPLRKGIYSVCHIKLKVRVNNRRSRSVNIKFHVKSYGGTANIVENFFFGLKEFSVNSSFIDTTYCIEYKCSGKLEASDTVDYTRIEITTPAPVSHNCHFSRAQNDLKSYNFSSHGKLNANINNKIYAPTHDGENYGIYTATTDNNDVEGAKRRSKDKCSSTTESQNNGVAIDFFCD